MKLLFMGPPGSGKGTQSQILTQRLGIPHLSTGDMFRAAIKAQTPVGVKAKGYMDRGEYVPDQVVIDLIADRMSEPDCKKGYILDGFPRTQPQAEALDQMLSSRGEKLDRVFFFQVTPDELVRRLSGRRTCRVCQKVVAVESHDFKAQAQECAQVSRGPCDFFLRDDDKPEVVQRRIAVYEAQTAPVVEYFKEKGVLVVLKAEQSTEAVSEQLQAAL